MIGISTIDKGVKKMIILTIKLIGSDIRSRGQVILVSIHSALNCELPCEAKNWVGKTIINITTKREGVDQTLSFFRHVQWGDKAAKVVNHKRLRIPVHQGVGGRTVDSTKRLVLDPVKCHLRKSGIRIFLNTPCNLVYTIWGLGWTNI